MRVLFKQLLLFFLCLLTTALHSQNNTDSLIAELSKKNLSDSCKITILQQISWQLKSTNPTEAIKYGNQALNLSRLNQYPDLEAKSLKNIATAHLLAGNYQKAESYFLTAVEIFDEVNDLEGKSSCYNNLGLTFEYKGSYIEALEAYKASITIDKATNNKKGEAASLSNWGNVLQNNGKYGEAIKKYMESLEIRYEINDFNGIATIYNNIGAIYEKQNNYKDAIKNYKEALSGYIEIDNKRQACIAMNNIGNVFYQQKKYNEALHYFKQTIDVRKKIDDKNGMAATLLNMANLYIDKGEYDTAFSCIDKSQKYYETIGNKYKISKAIMTKANYYLQQKQYRKVIELLNKIDYNTDVLPESQADIFHMLSEAYSGIGKYKKAFLNLKEYVNLDDSLVSSANSQKIIQMQMQYEFDKKENEREVQKEKFELQNRKEIMQKKLINRILLTIMVALFLISILIYRSYVLKKRDNKLLTFQKNQNEIINRELVKSQEKLVNEKHQTECKNKIIAEFVLYSQVIRETLLHDEYKFKETFKSNFVIHIPQNSNSGSFCMTKKKDEFVFVLVVNSMIKSYLSCAINTLAISIINKVLETANNYDSSAIVKSINNEIHKALHINPLKSDINKGINMSLCVINTELKELRFSGANNSLFILNDNNFDEIKGTETSIGLQSDNLAIKSHTLNIHEKDKFFLFTAGEIENVLNTDNHEITLDYFKKILLSHANKNMEDTRRELLNEINNLYDINEQLNEVLIFGFSDIA